MFCSCKMKTPDYPVAAHWGPPLWGLLHTLAERVSTSPTTQEDKHLWNHALTALPKVIPCPECREHAVAWIAVHPVAEYMALTTKAERRTWLIDWFYAFHESVNARLGKPSFEKARMSEIYRTKNLKEFMTQLKPFMTSAIQLSGVTILSWKRFVGFLIALQSVYGL